MIRSRRIPALVLSALALAGGRSAVAQDTPPPAAPDGVTVQPRGPVHEAFARPADTPAAGPVVPQQPPPPIKELPPEQKPEGDNVQWVPGYWSWDDEAKNYVWVSGCWRVPPPGRAWMPGRWAKADGGWRWQPGYWAGVGADAPRPLDAMPPRSLEVGPSTPSPNDDSYYTPGQWVFRDGEWAWQPGTWVRNPGGMAYTPPSYLPTPDGSLYVPGYWDYPLEDRGQLYAPVTVAGSPWVGNPGWAYQPNYAVGLGGLFGSLFARPGYGGYYFGNYFGGPYAGLGYVPWTAYGGRGYDPLLNYYRWSNRGNPGWYGGLSGLYAGRLNGTLPLPATTYAPHGFARPVVIAPAAVTRNTAAFGRGVSVNPVNSLQTLVPVGQLHGNHARLTNTTPGIPHHHQSFASPLTGGLTQPGVPAVRTPVAPVRPASLYLPDAAPGSLFRSATPTYPNPAHQAYRAPVTTVPPPAALRAPLALPNPAPVQPPVIHTTSSVLQHTAPSVRMLAPPSPVQVHRPAPVIHAAPAGQLPTLHARPAVHAAPAFHSAPAHHAAPAAHGGGGHRR